MNFYIKKGADLPILKVEPIKDGRSDYKKFMEDLQTSAILFSMIDTKNKYMKSFVVRLFLSIHNIYIHIV